MEFTERKLFCFDFDETLVKGHFHHLIHDARRQARNSGYEFDLVKCVNTY